MSNETSINLKNKIVVITGSAGLLGQEHANAILEAGGRVCLLDVNQNALDQQVNQLQEKYPHKILAVLTDITQKSSIQTALDTIKTHFGESPHVLINNAAIDPKVKKGETQLNHLEDFSIEQWNLEISVGLTGALLCTQVFGAEMAKHNSGNIINISSDLGVIAPDQRLYTKENTPSHEQPVKPVTYSVIKHGLIGLTKYTATYWASKGVRCNAFAPGGVYNNQPEAFVEKVSNLIPMGRMSKQGEYKGIIAFLASDASSYMNGTTIIADGGRSVW